MNQTLPKHRNVIFTLFIISSLIQTQSHQLSKKLTPKSLGFKKQKLTHLHFYFHDIISGDHPTAVRVAQAATSNANTSSTFFGVMGIIDDLLTLGPEHSSKAIGRAQGIFAFSSLSEARALQGFNFVFTEGIYNGSTLSILGSNAIFERVREMPVVGGSGLFRFARGYALTSTHFRNTSTGSAVLEYDVYVLHY